MGTNHRSSVGQWEHATDGRFDAPPPTIGDAIKARTPHAELFNFCPGALVGWLLAAVRCWEVLGGWGLWRKLRFVEQLVRWEHSWAKFSEDKPRISPLHTRKRIHTACASKAD